MLLLADIPASEDSTNPVQEDSNEMDKHMETDDKDPEIESTYL